jgi:hypothetical protein
MSFASMRADEDYPIGSRFNLYSGRLRCRLFPGAHFTVFPEIGVPPIISRRREMGLKRLRPLNWPPFLFIIALE